MSTVKLQKFKAEK